MTCTYCGEKGETHESCEFADILDKATTVGVIGLFILAAIVFLIVST